MGIYCHATHSSSAGRYHKGPTENLNSLVSGSAVSIGCSAVPNITLDVYSRQPKPSVLLPVLYTYTEGRTAKIKMPNTILHITNILYTQLWQQLKLHQDISCQLHVDLDSLSYELCFVQLSP